LNPAGWYRCSAAIPATQLMAGAQQIGCDRLAHLTETDESYVH
jgi:hypothetical protein